MICLKNVFHILNFCAHLNLSEDALVEFVQVFYMPNQERAIQWMDGKQHVWALVPLCDQSLHLPL